MGYKNTVTGVLDDWYFIPGIESMHIAFILKMNKAPNYYGIPEIIFKARDGSESKVIEESGTDTNHVFIIPLLDILDDLGINLEDTSTSFQPVQGLYPTYRLAGLHVKADLHVSNFEHAQSMFDNTLRMVTSLRSSAEDGIFECAGWLLTRTGNRRYENSPLRERDVWGRIQIPIDHAYHCGLNVEMMIHGKTCKPDIIVATIQIGSIWILLGMSTIVVNEVLACCHKTFIQVTNESAEDVLTTQEIVFVEKQRRSTLRDDSNVNMQESIIEDQNLEMKQLKNEASLERMLENSESEDFQHLLNSIKQSIECKAFVAKRDFKIEGTLIRKGWVLYVVKRKRDQIRVNNQYMLKSVWIPQNYFGLLRGASNDIIRNNIQIVEIESEEISYDELSSSCSDIEDAHDGSGSRNSR